MCWKRFRTLPQRPNSPHPGQGPGPGSKLLGLGARGFLCKSYRKTNNFQQCVGRREPLSTNLLILAGLFVDWVQVASDPSIQVSAGCQIAGAASARARASAWPSIRECGRGWGRCIFGFTVEDIHGVFSNVAVSAGLCCPVQGWGNPVRLMLISMHLYGYIWFLGALV
jgi:hypothetical protein